MFQFAGGVQEVVFQLQVQLQKKGHQAIIITPRPRSYFEDTPKDMILLGRSTKMNTPFATMVDFGFEADGEEIAAILEREQFDILHFHEPWQPVLSRQILTRSNTVNVATFHGTPPDTIMSKSLLNMVIPYTRSVLKYIHSYTAVSEPAAGYIRTLTDEHVEIIPNGIDINKFKAPKTMPHESKKTILYLGRLERRKGVKFLIDAYARLRENHEDVKLVIAGNGVKSKSLERYVEEYEIPDVSFIGYVKECDKVNLMATADLYCSPAQYGESFGIVLLEAMAVGTPLVAGNNPGYASVMKDLGRVSLVTPTLTEDFAMRLELMLYNEEIRKIWKDWAKKEVQKYNFEKVATEYETTYKKALKVYAQI